MHKKNIATWETCCRLLVVRFGDDAGGVSYRCDGQTHPKAHISACIQAWQDKSTDKWVHLFIHTLDTTPRNWYTEIELHRGIESWSLWTESLLVTFGFESEYTQVENALGVIGVYLFDDYPSLTASHLDQVAQIETTMDCYNFATEEDDDLHNVNILKSERSHDVQGLVLDIPKVIEKVKTKEVNIETDANPKMASIGDYWHDQTVGHIADLLQEYQDLFLTKFTKMKGILRDLGVMKVPLREGAKPFKQCPYRLNPKYKEKVKQKLDKMLVAGIIEPVEESEWVGPMVVEDKKTKGEIKICMDLRKLDDASMHDPFHTPFTYEVLDNVGGQEVYSFTNGFSRYHQIRIHKDNMHKTTFAIEWGSFQYTVMSFGLKNAPAIFSRVVVVVFKEFIHRFVEVYFDDGQCLAY